MGAQLAIAADLENTEDTLSPTHASVQPSDDAIRERSRQIWEREGRPEGRSEEHWNRARAELAELLARTANASADERAPDEIVPPVPDEIALPVPADTPPSSPSPESVEASEAALIALLEEFERECEAPNTQEVPPALNETVPASAFPFRLPPVRRSNSTVPSIITAGNEFRGVLESPGDIQFDGFMEGTLCGASLVVDENADIRGDVVAGDVIVRGHVNGRICAYRVVLRCGCHVEGEIHYGSLAVENGAELDGTFHHWETAQAEEDEPFLSAQPSTEKSLLRR